MTYREVEKLFEDAHTWVKGAFRGSIGQVVLCPDRLLLFKRRTSAGRPGEVFDSVTDKILLDVPLSAVTSASRHHKGMQKDRIKFTTADGEYLFSGGWNDLGPAVRNQIEALGRSTVADGDDAWRVT